MRFELLPHLTRCWMPRGRQPEVRTPGKNKKIAAFGAFCYGRYGRCGKAGGLFLYHTQPHATVQFFEFATHKIIPIWTLENPDGPGFAVSADGRSILYVQNEFTQSNIMLVKNFR